MGNLAGGLMWTSAAHNASHFTALRILSLLLDHRGESNPEGQGYVELGRVVGLFADIFDNVRDLAITLDRLVSRQLIEVNMRSTETVSGASHLRVTAAGWYYLKFLARTFAYLDLVLQDTPLNDSQIERYLRQSVYDVNNLTDREDEREDRMQVRFERTQLFLRYLADEEKREFQLFDMNRLPAPLSVPFMPAIQARFTDDRQYIENRLHIGRVADTPDEPDDKFAEQYQFTLDEGDAGTNIK